MSRSRPADVWVLLGPHKGDNNQVLALAERLNLPFRVISLRYRWFAHFPALLRLVTHFGLAPEARLEIAPPWPSIVLGIGQRSAPIARYIRHRSGGRATIVRLGDPMAAPGLFDLVITTTQYAVPDADNVIRLPITITNDPSNRMGRRRNGSRPLPDRAGSSSLGGRRPCGGSIGSFSATPCGRCHDERQRTEGRSSPSAAHGRRPS